MSYWKQYYLKEKYREVEDDAAISGKRRSKRKAVQKSDHKHTYKNCVLRVPGWNGNIEHMLGSYCTQCGKIGPYDKNDHFYQETIDRFDIIFSFIPRKYKDAFCERYEVFEIGDVFDKYIGEEIA
jgi:hypothetical protein